MGLVVSKVAALWTPTNYDVPDSTTGITPRQKDIVQNTWRIVRRDVKNNGIKLFLMFFEEYPEYQKLFKGFADVSKDKLSRNGRLLGHATAVIYAFSSIVDNLEDLECLVEVLHKIGSSHKEKNISAQHFQHLAKVLIPFLDEVIGPMDTRTREAWTKAIEVANCVIIKALEDEKA